MKINDVQEMQENLRIMADDLEREYWLLAKRLQKQAFKNRSDQRLCMTLQSKVLECLKQTEQAVAEVAELKHFAQREKELFQSTKEEPEQ